MSRPAAGVEADAMGAAASISTAMAARQLLRLPETRARARLRRVKGRRR
jgi:hypothetical protein